MITLGKEVSAWEKKNAQCFLDDGVVFLCHELKIASAILNELFDINDIFQLRHDFSLFAIVINKIARVSLTTVIL